MESSLSAGDLIVPSAYSLAQRNGEALEQQVVVDAQLALIKMQGGEAPTLQRPHDIVGKRILSANTKHHFDCTDASVNIPVEQKFYRATTRRS